MVDILASSEELVYYRSKVYRNLHWSAFSRNLTLGVQHLRLRFRKSEYSDKRRYLSLKEWSGMCSEHTKPLA
jgi:hypothetical protein